MDAQATGQPLTQRAPSYRWMQLFMGICCMVMIANLQYGWTLFVNPITEKYGWTRAAIQIAFTIFVITETWLVPIEGYLVDRFGPRPVVLVGGLLCGVGWVLNSYASSLMAFWVLPLVPERRPCVDQGDSSKPTLDRVYGSMTVKSSRCSCLTSFPP